MKYVLHIYILFKHQRHPRSLVNLWQWMRLQIFNLPEQWMHCTGAVHWKEISNFIAIPQFPHYLEATAEWCLMTNTWVVSTWSNMAHWHSTHSAFQLMLWTDPLDYHTLVSPSAGLLQQCTRHPLGDPRSLTADIVIRWVSILVTNIICNLTWSE